MIGFFGKHPSKGDFIGGGLPVQAGLEAWLDGALAETRHGLAEAWESIWAQARPLRFWIGPSQWGEAVAGVMLASADAVGRRYPLMIVAVGEDCPQAPVIVAQQGWYETIETHLQAALLADSFGLAGLKLPQITYQPDGPPEFWAVRPGAEMAGLLEDIAMTDHQRALHNRSYWWMAGIGAQQAQVWAGEGLPNGHVLAWFLRGYVENG